MGGFPEAGAGRNGGKGSKEKTKQNPDEPKVPPCPSHPYKSTCSYFISSDAQTPPHSPPSRGLKNARPVPAPAPLLGDVANGPQPPSLAPSVHLLSLALNTIHSAPDLTLASSVCPAPSETPRGLRGRGICVCFPAGTGPTLSTQRASHCNL